VGCTGEVAVNTKNFIKVRCCGCGIVFERQVLRTIKALAHYHNKACKEKYYGQEMITLDCNGCGIQFERRKSLYLKNKPFNTHHYCTKSCMRLFQQARMCPVNSPSMRDIAWAAGVYEGEGTCHANIRRTNSITLSISQKDLWLLQRLKMLFGGEIYDARSISMWVLAGARARGFLMTIYALLSPRRQKQIRKALA
jgi:hypothetical protein